jgi:hypothetical protein
MKLSQQNQEQETKEWDLDMALSFMQFFFEYNPYSYQRRFIDACLKSKRVVAKWPRQSGKSTTVSVYALFRAITSKCNIVIIAPSQSQSGELYDKVRSVAIDNPAINKLIIKSTETEMKFANGSRIISLPCGPEGRTIKGYTADILILEESGLLKDMIVNTVAIPMVAATNGQIIKIGTPWTRNHFYRSCFEDKNYILISIDWKEVVEQGQYTQEFIDEQKSQLSDIEFRTEYESEFIDDALSFFPTSLLEDCKCTYSLFVIY